VSFLNYLQVIETFTDQIGLSFEKAQGLRLLYGVSYWAIMVVASTDVSKNFFLASRYSGFEKN
jgi:hypothetical protein